MLHDLLYIKEGGVYSKEYLVDNKGEETEHEVLTLNELKHISKVHMEPKCI